MNVIDHAILISASPAFIWRVLGDVSQNPTWQEDCNNVSFLTTQHEGKGARWRYSTPKSNDIVVEITAWYDTLGYEYIIVDGGSVSENKGRMRLQEIAEGTLVQWTFNYEVDGIFSGLRNSMSLKRSLSNNIQDSLRNLYKLIQSETGGIPTHEAKALVKEAPDVEERSSYEPRHPSSIQDSASDETFADPDYPSEQPILYNIQSESIPEPPVADDDTKPNPVVQGTEEISVMSDIAEPSFLQQIPEPPIADDDTKPNAPIEVPAPPPTVDIEEPIVESIESSSPPSQPDSAITTPKPNIRDTATVSIFDLFGLQKPSETEEMRALSEADLEQDVPVPTPPPSALEADPDEVMNSLDTIETTSVKATPEAGEGGVEIEEESATITEAVVIDSIPDDESDIDKADDLVAILEFDFIDSEPDIVDPVKASSIERIIGLRLGLRRNVIRLRHRK